jgi:hypothetical protein
MITAVTGFVPLPGHLRSEQTYRTLGKKLLDCNIPIVTLENDLEECWLYEYLQEFKLKPTHSVSDNPDKNTVNYHIVQAQKSEWLAVAATQNPEADVLVWIDYGIFHFAGMTPEIIQDFMAKVAGERAIAIPGCWSEDYIYDDHHPCWRFCGGVIVMPRRYVFTFDRAMKREYVRWLDETNNLSWEVNTMARVERCEPDLPIWHYRADHGRMLFTEYKAGVENAL